MKQPKLAARILVFITLLSGLLLLLFIPNIPQGTHLWRELLDAGHAILFGVLAVVLLWTARGRETFLLRALMTQLLLVGIPLFLFGIATEIIQPYFQRDGELIDVLRDTAGIVVALCSIAIMERASSWRKKPGNGVVWLLRGAVILLVLLVFETTGVWCLAYVHRDRAFPILASFETNISRKFVRPYQAEFEPIRIDPDTAATDWTGWGKIWFEKTQYTGITIDELHRSWQGYDSLEFELYSSLSSPIDLGLRVEDRDHDYSYSDRFNAGLLVKPGLNRYAYAIGDIARAPRRRHMNLDNMGKIWIFAVNPPDTFSMLVSPITLIR